ncbi:MAG: hypothetical protein ACRCYT_05380, partial [Cetobacterium sp.]
SVGGGGGSTTGVEDFYLNPNNEFEFILKLVDGTTKKIDFIHTLEAFHADNMIDVQSPHSEDYNNFIWKHAMKLNETMNIPLTKFLTRKKKGDVRVVTKNAEDIIIIPKATQKISIEGMLTARWGDYSTQTTDPLKGYFASDIVFEERRIGDTVWKPWFSYTSDRFENYESKEPTVSLYPNVWVNTPDYPCEMKIGIRYTSFGINPNELTRSEFRWGVANFKGSTSPNYFKVHLENYTALTWEDF